MHILLVFLIGIAVVSGFHPQRERPAEEVRLPSAPGQPSLDLRALVEPLSEIENKRVVKQGFDYSCGSAALATLLNFYLGEQFSEQQVIQGLMRHGDSKQIARRRAFSLLDMKRFVKVLGYRGAGYRATLEDLQALDGPGIVPVKIYEYRHFAVFKGMHKGHVLLADPWRGNISLSMAEFRNMWFENVVFLVQAPGAREQAGVRLREEELRFIDAESTRQMLFDRPPQIFIPAQRRLDDMPGSLQMYKR